MKEEYFEKVVTYKESFRGDLEIILFAMLFGGFFLNFFSDTALEYNRVFAGIALLISGLLLSIISYILNKEVKWRKIK